MYIVYVHSRPRKHTFFPTFVSHGKKTSATLFTFKGTLSRTRMRQLFESQLEKPDFFKFEVLNSKWRPRRKTEELGGKGILEKKSSFDKARKRCHKRIFHLGMKL